MNEPGQCDRGFIGRIQPNNIIQMLYMYNEIDEDESDSNNESYNEENSIIQEIIAKTAVAACNTSVDISIIVGS